MRSDLAWILQPCSAVPIASHCGPGDLESSGDLADRPVFVDNELGDFEAVSRGQGGVGVDHDILSR